MAYGDKRDYPRIDIYVKNDGNWFYYVSTTWAKTCKEAKERFCNSVIAFKPENVKCFLAKN